MPLRAAVAPLLAVAAACALLAAPGRPGGLTSSQERGRRLYLEGKGSSAPVLARLDGSAADVPAEALACAGCHGRDGRGSVEGGVVAPDIRWEALAAIAEDGTATGRRRPAYDSGSLGAAVTTGADPAGNRLHPAMPRYRIASADLLNLLDYLRVLGTEPAAGVTESEIAIGALVPLSGPAAGEGGAVRDALEAFLRAANAHGGVHGRRLRLLLADAAGAGGPLPALRDLERRGVFCLIAALVPGQRDSGAIEDELRRLELPLIGPMTLSTDGDVLPNPYVFHLLPGLGDQIDLLLDHALSDLPASVALAVGTGPLWSGARRRFERALASRRARGGQVVAIPPPPEGAGRVVEALAASRPDAVIVIGSSLEVVAATAALRRSPWSPRVLTLAALAGRRIVDLPEDAAQGIVLTYPGPLPDEAPEALSEYSVFALGAGISPRHVAFQLVALAAAQVLTEGLKRSGRDLSREGLVASLETLRRFPTIMGAPVTFGPNRRNGSREATLVRPDPARRGFVALSPRRATVP